MVCPARQQRAGRPRLEVADVFGKCKEQPDTLTADEARVIGDITSCRTSTLGGHLQQCDTCDYEKPSYNSCRNRHCPKCQGLDEVRWVERQQDALLPIEYHHVVFTIPDVLHPLLRCAPRVGYGLLFAAVAETLKEVALRPKNLGARIGFTAVLHTWTQKLAFHPHIHCIVTGGGLSLDGSRWVSAKPGFLFFVGVLARVFQGKLLSKLEKMLSKGDLPFQPQDGKSLLRTAARKHWKVYSKPPFAGPEQVLRYLGRYTHRIAISNERLVALQDGEVTFRWRDSADNNRKKLMKLSTDEFRQRFLLHVLPSGFFRIRHFGLLANANRKERIATCRALLGADLIAVPKDQTSHDETWQEMLLRLAGIDVTRCPRCKTGRLGPGLELPPAPAVSRFPLPRPP